MQCFFKVMVKDHSIMQFNKSKNLNQLKTQCKKQNNALNSNAKLDLDLLRDISVQH